MTRAGIMLVPPSQTGADRLKASPLMTEKNYWTRLRSSRISRRRMLGASARMGVGAAGLALVGCGDDDDDDAAVAQAQAQAEEVVPDEAEDQTEPAPAPEATVNLNAHLRIAVAGDAGGLDPLRSGSHLNYISHAAVHDNFMDRDQNTSELLANLVGLEIVDDTTYLLHHTPGVQFHDGTPFTAEDTAFTFERAGQIAAYHDGGETSDYPDGWTSARLTFGSQTWAGYEVTDPATLRVNVESPDATFGGNYLAIIYGQSKAYVEGVGDLETDRTPLGTGPFRFVSHSDDTDFRFTRYDDYHRARPEAGNSLERHVAWVKDMTGVIRPELLSRVAAVEAGEIDAAPALPLDLVTPFIGDDDFKVIFQQAARGATHQLMPNTHQPLQPDGSPNPFLDIRVRQAMNMAINREAYIENLLGGAGAPSFGPPPPALGWNIPQATKDEIYWGYQPEQARQLMANAGYADGFDTTLHIVTDYASIIPLLALVVQQELAEIGIRAEIKEYPSGNYFSDDAVRARPGEAGLWWFFTNAQSDPESWLVAEINAGAFYTVSEYPETRIQELYEAQKVALDPDTRVGVLHDLFVENYRNASWLFLHEAQDAVLMRSNVEWDTGITGLRDEGTTSIIKIFNA